MSGLRIIPCTLPQANGVVAVHHRHHAPLPGGFAWYCCAAVEGRRVCGASISGRPTNRNNDDGSTVEVLRVATDGTPNAPSMLLGAAARAAKAIGASRIITYTLDAESGVSLKASGWRLEADSIQSWWTHEGADGNGRTPAVERPHHQMTKTRWAVHFTANEKVDDPIWPVITDTSPQMDLFADLEAAT